MTDKIASTWIKCGYCFHRFLCGIQFGDVASFEGATVTSSRQQCPSCKKVIHCNKDNMSYVLEGSVGGEVGPDFGGNKGP